MLALKYRPKDLDEVVGQNSVSRLLKAMVDKDQIPQAMIFSGSRGTGKTSTARILAETLAGRIFTRPVGENEQSFSYSSHDPAILEIDAASNGLVDDIRRLRESMSYNSSRIVVLDEAHSMSREAFNAFLKILEEPPGHATFILVTTEPNKIPETIRSRCIEFEFQRIPHKAIYERLVYVINAEERPDIEPELLEFIALRANGGLRDALMMLDQALRADICSLSQYQEVLGHIDAGPVLLQACITSPAEALKTLRRCLAHISVVDLQNSLTDILRDCLLLNAGQDISYSGDALETRKSLAQGMDTSEIIKAMKIMWDVTLADTSTNPIGSLELAAVMISEAVSKKAASNSTLKEAEVSKKKATLRDLQSL